MRDIYIQLNKILDNLTMTKIQTYALANDFKTSKRILHILFLYLDFSLKLGLSRVFTKSFGISGRLKSRCQLSVSFLQNNNIVLKPHNAHIPSILQLTARVIILEYPCLNKTRPQIVDSIAVSECILEAEYCLFQSSIFLKNCNSFQLSCTNCPLLVIKKSEQ